MPDITMCHGDGCNKKHECRRFTAEPSGWQSYFQTPPFDKETGECKHFREE